MSSRRLPTRLPQMLAAALVAVLALPSLSLAGKWIPPKELKPQYYKMQATQIDRRGNKTVSTFSVDIQATDEVDAKGKPVFRVTTTQERTVSGKELNPAALAFGGWGITMGAGMSMQWMMYGAMFGDLELAVGEKLSFFGGMLAKVTAKETIAGQEGFVVELFRKKNDEHEKIAELVLNPDIPVAMRSRTYQKEKLTGETVMLEYKAR